MPPHDDDGSTTELQPPPPPPPPPSSSQSTGNSSHHHPMDIIHNRNNASQSIASSAQPPHDPHSQSYIMETQTQTQTELLTQTQECCTQMGEFDEDEEVSNLSPCPPLSPQPALPWGRLLPCSDLNQAYNLMPRAPGVEQEHTDQESSSNTVTGGRRSGGAGGMGEPHRPSNRTPPPPVPPALNLHQVTPSDIFNIHWLGRSQSCDVTVTIKPKKAPPTTSPVPSTVVAGGAASDGTATAASTSSKSAKKLKHEAAMQVWAHSMISNQHCRIFCVLSEHVPPATSTAGPSGTPAVAATIHSFEVYVENMSANGTLINQTTILQKGEKRLLHSGDEICLVNPNVLQKKCRSRRILNLLSQNYSFVFVNEQQKRRSPSLLTIAGLSLYPPKRKQACVNPRAMNYHHKQPQPPLPAPQQPLPNNNYRPSNNNKSNNHHPHHQPTSWARRIEAVYDLRDVLGDGTCGQVRRAIHRGTGQQFAVKIIPLRRNRQFLDATQMEQEANILRSLDHPYIVKLIDVFVSPGIAMYLVMELLQGGDLFDRIVAKEHYTQVESRRVLRRLLSAVYYLHEQRNIVHRDLKPENILCVHDNIQSIEVKLTDFGLAKIINEDDGLKTFCGTPQYFAPEVFQRRNTVKGRGRYGKPADMWSLGVILYVLISGGPPFSPNMDADEKIPVIEFPDDIWHDKPLAKDLVQKLLREDPKRRLSVRQACDHAWLLVDDGDTHVHPLEDPIVTTRKRLFASPVRNDNDGGDHKEPLPTTMTSAAQVPTAPVPRQESEDVIVDFKIHNNDDGGGTSNKVVEDASAALAREDSSSVATSSTTTTATKLGGKGEEETSSVMSKEDFAKSAVAGTYFETSSMTTGGRHRRSGSVFEVPHMAAPAEHGNVSKSGDAPPPRLVAPNGNDSPMDDRNHSSSSSHAMEFEVAAGNTSTPSSSSSIVHDNQESSSSPSQQDHSSPVDSAATTTTAAMGGELKDAAVVEVTPSAVVPSDDANSADQPLSPRVPLLQLSLNQRCNQFRERVLIRGSQKTSTSHEDEDETTIKKVDDQEPESGTAVSSAKNDTTQGGVRQATGSVAGRSAVTPTASNRTKILRSLGGPAADNNNNNNGIKMDDDISHFSDSEASESLSSFGSSTMGSPAAVSSTETKTMLTNFKTNSAAQDDDAGADPNSKKRRRLFAEAANIDDSKTDVDDHTKKDDAPPTKRAKRPSQNEGGRQTLLTAWMFKKPAPPKAKRSTQERNNGSDDN